MKKWEDTCKKMSATLRDQIYNVLLFPMGGWLVDVAEVSGFIFIPRGPMYSQLIDNSALSLNFTL